MGGRGVLPILPAPRPMTEPDLRPTRLGNKEWAKSSRGPRIDPGGVTEVIVVGENVAIRNRTISHRSVRLSPTTSLSVPLGNGARASRELSNRADLPIPLSWSPCFESVVCWFFASLSRLAVQQRQRTSRLIFRAPVRIRRSTLKVNGG